jgi:NAD(P)-dependent dehydrogenase (short-subunit alcohol dehydrogenase family)
MKHGRVNLNTCSIQAFDPGESLVAYAATKSTLVSMTKTFSELAMKKGIRVNAVAPGPVWTPRVASTKPEEKIKSFGQNTALERAAMPVGQAAVFVFLASDDASYVTGEIYDETGGRMPY